MSQLKVNSIVDANGTSNAVLYGVAAPTGSMGFRNRILNGDMRIDQRNAGASVTPTNGSYTVDRWAAVLTQASKFTAQQNAGSVTPPAGFTNYLGITSSSAYSVLTGDAFGVYQWIEGFNCADLAWGTANAQAVTLSFWVRSSLTGTFGGSLINSAANRSYVFSYTISAANTWEQKTVNIAGDTSGTWLTTNGAGIMVRYGLGSGSTFTGSAGSWGAGNIVQPTSSVSLVGTNGATFYITGVQLEAGSVATPFERRDYGRELIMCQRYYQLYSGVYGSAGGSTIVYAVFQLPVTMRSGPTASVSNALAMTLPGVAAYTQSSANVSAAASSSTTSVFLSFGNFSGMTTGNPITMNGTSQFVQLSAEL